MRKIIETQTYDEERALYHSEECDIKSCVFAGKADGESVLKESRDITLQDCIFSLRYPLWHVKGFSMQKALWTKRPELPFGMRIIGAFGIADWRALKP